MLGIAPMATDQIQSTNDAAAAAADDSASSLLPFELLLSVLCLCRPALHLPATCQELTACLSLPGDKPHRIWVQHQVFRNPEHDPHVVNQSPSPALEHHNINIEEPATAQIESPLSYYLKAHAPTPSDKTKTQWCAEGLAPEPGIEVSVTILSAKFVDWLFSYAGPFQRQRRQLASNVDVVAELQRIQPADISSASLARTWRLIPDAFLLASFFIRTSQIDLLESTLVHIRSLFPSLDTVSAPFSVWVRLMLDNRHRRLSSLVEFYGDPSVTYHAFLCLLAFLDWSFPSIQVVSRVFGDNFDAAAPAKVITSDGSAVYGMLEHLDELRSPPSGPRRVLDVLHWFRDVAGISLTPKWHQPVSSNVRNSYPIFAGVLREYDAANLRHMHPRRSRHDLGSRIAEWIEKTGHLDMLDIALQYDLFGEDDKVQVARHPALAGSKAVEFLMMNVREGCDKELKAAVARALNLNFSHSPSTYVSLFNLLITRASTAIDPTDFILAHKYNWSYDGQSAMLFSGYNTDDLLFVFDYSKLLGHHLRYTLRRGKLTSESMELTFKLILRCLADGDVRVWDDLDAGQVATACAMVLVAASHLVDDDSIELLTDEHMAAVDFLVARTLANARVAAPDSPSFSQLISDGCRKTLGSGVAYAAAFAPAVGSACTCDGLLMHAHTCAMAHPLAAHNVLIDKLLVLDRAFVVANVPTAFAVSVRVWSRFTVAEVAPQLFWHRAVSLLRQVVEPDEPNVAANVAALIDHFPAAAFKSGSFARGVYRLMEQYPEQKAEILLGLDQSRGWRGWAEEVAGVVPQDEEEEEDDDDDDDDAVEGES